MTVEDLRKNLMLNWLENDLQLPVKKCEPASSDASFRRYFRITLPNRHFILMDAPPDKENTEPFIRVAGLLSESGVKVPTIYFDNKADGFLVLEDFGSQSLLDQLNEVNADVLYGNALASLFTLQTQVDISKGNLPCYDKALLQRELGIFEEWFIRHHLAFDLAQSLWQTVCEILIESALTQPLTCVHRDYHSRNLMVINDDSMGIIDFQDAVVGPITYDVVSLLRDCYIAWPQARVEQWLGTYYQKLLSVGLIACSLAQFTRWFDLMGMQRHLKAIGIFSRLNYRDGKPGYLKDMPRTLNYVVEQAEKYSELAEFHQLLIHDILPKFEVVQ